MLKKLFGFKSKEATPPLTPDQYSEAATTLEQILGLEWINEIQKGRIPFPGEFTTVGEQQKRFIFVSPEGVTIHNARVRNVDLPFTVSKEFIVIIDGSSLGDARNYLLDTQLVANMLQLISDIAKD